jgi:hypothetical protein
MGCIEASDSRRVFCVIVISTGLIVKLIDSQWIDYDWTSSLSLSAFALTAITLLSN